MLILTKDGLVRQYNDRANEFEISYKEMKSKLDITMN